MDIRNIYKQILELWPDEIDLSEAKLHENGGATIPHLILIHDSIGDINIQRGIEYEAMEWAIFQTLHMKAKEIISNGGSILERDEISIDSVKKNYEVNIASIKKERNI